MEFQQHPFYQKIADRNIRAHFIFSLKKLYVNNYIEFTNTIQDLCFLLISLFSHIADPTQPFEFLYFLIILVCHIVYHTCMYWK